MAGLEKTADFSLESHLPFRVLHPHEAQRYYEFALYRVDEELAHLAQLYWVLRWDLSGDESFDAQVVPSAYTNFTCMPEGARVTGVTTGLYDYQVRGSGVIAGIMFRPGGIAAFHGAPRELVDRFVPARELFPGADDAFNARVIAETDDGAIGRMREEVLARMPAADPNIELVNEIIERSRGPEASTVRAIARDFAISERKLQGLFERYVGVGLKWIMLRDRLQHATLLADTLEHPDWSAIAYDLGYGDQSHFINDFKRIIGMTPGQYAAARRADDRRDGNS